MNRIDNRTIAALAALIIIVLLAVPLAAQNRTQFAGQVNAYDYAYGVQQNVGALVITGGPYPAGANTFTVSYGAVTAGDGTTFYPLATNAPVIIGNGGTQETVTPSAVSCNTPAIYNTCTFTATTSNAHGNQENVRSGTVGLQEAINVARANGGGSVIIGARWAGAGGTSTLVSAASGYSNVTIQDTRSGNTFWTLQPSTLTSLAAPTTLTSSTVVFAASPVGTWAASAYYFCVSYVDALGGEGPCSATYNQTPTVNYSVTITSPAASTGAVGWRFYAGASYNAAYLMPIDSTHCTLTTLESVMPACAIGSNGGWIAPPLTTTTLRPNAQSPTVNLNLPMPQGHTTFAYAPAPSQQLPFQTHYGPFPAFGSTTSGQTDVIGSANLPTGFLNTIGRTVRISGKIALTANTAAVPSFFVGLGWIAGLTAGAPVPVCTYVGAAYGSSAAFNVNFSCTLVTNATGSSAATIMTDGWLNYAAAAGAAGGVMLSDTAVAVVGSLGLSQQDTVYIYYTSGTNTTSAIQLLDLNVEALQ